jgi:V/A-type H+-transporting ATPase subunit D
MVLQDIKPTRSELIRLKRQIRFSERGYNILKLKRDGLILEFRKVLEDAKRSQSDLQDAYRRSMERIAIAHTVQGSIGVKAAALSRKETPEIELTSKNIMGVVVPEIRGSKVKKGILERGYSLIGTSSVIDAAAEGFEDLVEAVIRSAEIETTLKRLLDDIEGTKRRVNALEYRVIPELKTASAFIKMRLDEMEREELFRLKKIKARERE